MGAYSIPLQVQAPNIANPIDMAQKLTQLKNSGINTQENQLKLGQEQQGVQDDTDTRAATAAATDPTTGKVDRSTLIQTLAKLNPYRASQVQQSLTQQDQAAQQAAALQQKTQADAVKLQLENAKAHVDLKDQLLQGVTDQPTWTNARNIAIQQGINPAELPQQYDPQFVAQAHAQALTQKEVIAQHQKDLEDQEKAQNDAAERTEASKRDANTASYQKGELGLGYSRLKMEKDKQSFDNNASVEAMAQQVASGDIKRPTITRNNPFNEAVVSRAMEINPQLTDSLYNMNQQLRSDKPNSMGANVTRLGTAILHGDRALDNSNNLGFSEGLLTGIPTAATAAYKQDAEFLTGEVGQFVTGGKLTVDEGKKISSDLMSSRQSVRDAALKQIIDLSGGKLKAQQEQFANATKNPFPTDRVFNDPDIKAALVKHGVLPNGGGGQSTQGRGGAPAGATHIVRGPDGKNHYTNDKGTVDLGVAP